MCFSKPWFWCSYPSKMFWILTGTWQGFRSCQFLQFTQRPWLHASLQLSYTEGSNSESNACRWITELQQQTDEQGHSNAQDVCTHSFMCCVSWENIQHEKNAQTHRRRHRKQACSYRLMAPGMSLCHSEPSLSLEQRIGADRWSFLVECLRIG